MRKRILACALCLGACGGDLTALEGIYEVSEWTENESGCDSPGESILADQTEKLLYLRAENFFGVEFLNAVPCANLEECREEAADETISLNGFAFEDGSDSSGWRGTGHFISGSDTCSGEVFEDTLESLDDDSLLLTRRSVAVEGVPLDSDGFCDGDAAEEMAETLPCTRLEQIRAVLAEDL